jgi:TonB family protein
MARSSTQPSLSSADLADGPAVGGPPKVAVLLVTADDTLWTQLTTALPGLDVHQFDSAAELAGAWSAARPAVVLVDARLESGVGAAVERILTHGGALVPVALSDDEHEPAVTQLERKRSLFDHVRLPVDGGSARTIIERATEEAQARLLLTAGDTGLGAGRPRRGAGGRRPLLIGAAILAAALVAAGAYYFLASPPTPEAPAAQAAAGGQPAATHAAAATTAAPVSSGVSPEDVEALLERARAAMREKRYVDPAGDNALKHYKSVLDVDATNGEARQGLDRIAELMIGRATAGVAAHDYPTALRALEIARSLKPDHPRLAALDAQLGERMHDLALAQIDAALQANAFSRAAALIQQAEKAGSLSPAQLQQLKQDSARREAAAQLGNLARLAQARIAQGKLFEPADDSAKRYLKELQEKGGAAEAEELARLTDAYLRRATTEARAAIGRAAFADADAWIAELRSAGLPAAQLAGLQHDEDQARQQAKANDQARVDAAAAAAAAAAARDAAAAAAPSAATGPVVATPPQLQHALSLDYPDRAAAAGIEGWVDVAFDVSAKGAVSNAHVVAAQPSGAFDRAAISAISRARFAPAKAADGSAMATSTKMHIRFTLQAGK